MSTDLFESNATYFPFLTKGTSIKGVVSRDAVKSQCRNMTTGELETWADGNPKWQIIINIQTDQGNLDHGDDGERCVYAKSGLFKAVRTACRTAKLAGIPEGTGIEITYTHDLKAEKGKAPAKVYDVVLTPAPRKVEQATTADRHYDDSASTFAAVLDGLGSQHARNDAAKARTVAEHEIPF